MGVADAQDHLDGGSDVGAGHPKDQAGDRVDACHVGARLPQPLGLQQVGVEPGQIALHGIGKVHHVRRETSRHGSASSSRFARCSSTTVLPVPRSRTA